VVLIRPRRAADLGPCADLVREVHAADRYPRFLPADIGAFLAVPDPYGCWVADLAGEVIGHAALVPRGLPAATQLAASALGMPAERLAVVARLLVSPRARGKRAGRMLLDAATAEAAACTRSSTWTPSSPPPSRCTSPPAGPAPGRSRCAFVTASR